MLWEPAKNVGDVIANYFTVWEGIYMCLLIIEYLNTHIIQRLNSNSRGCAYFRDKPLMHKHVCYGE